MEHIKRLTQLHDVNVNRSQVTDAGVAELHRALPNCQISR
jgi:hypothetical protein